MRHITALIPASEEWRADAVYEPEDVDWKEKKRVIAWAVLSDAEHPVAMVAEAKSGRLVPAHELPALEPEVGTFTGLWVQ